MTLARIDPLRSDERESLNSLKEPELLLHECQSGQTADLNSIQVLLNIPDSAFTFDLRNATATNKGNISYLYF